jgi:hypothetical protein
MRKHRCKLQAPRRAHSNAPPPTMEAARHNAPRLLQGRCGAGLGGALACNGYVGDGLQIKYNTGGKIHKQCKSDGRLGQTWARHTKCLT